MFPHPIHGIKVASVDGVLFGILALGTDPDRIRLFVSACPLDDGKPAAATAPMSESAACLIGHGARSRRICMCIGRGVTASAAGAGTPRVTVTTASGGSIIHELYVITGEGVKLAPWDWLLP
ncbi:hypothetical protein EVAR_5032_1 [Eumeta japonica]|uniref:Uncharacterized protein n=1 Tax=Eumeta variegata TaxID=151549 RepID=A0A4C1SX01_EUMVA|nr:hypothetical protein EVAR_5032_1 [Eumeta japonica]